MDRLASEHRASWSTTLRRGATAPRLPWTLLGVVAAGALALAGGWTHHPALTSISAGLLLLLWLPQVWRRHTVGAVSIWLGLAVLTAGSVLLGRAGLVWMAGPVLIPTWLCWLFARTLRRGAMPLIERCVRLVEGDQYLELPGVRRYVRGVTLFWALLLGAMALASLVVALYALPGGWFMALGVRAPPTLPDGLLHWYPEVGSWGIVALAFVGEYLFRRWHLRGIPQTGARRCVILLVRHWPALVRGENS